MQSANSKHIDKLVNTILQERFYEYGLQCKVIKKVHAVRSITATQVSSVDLLNKPHLRGHNLPKQYLQTVKCHWLPNFDILQDILWLVLWGQKISIAMKQVL